MIKMVDKDIARIPKNNDTEIVVRVDDFGGRRGVTIREFVKSERYTGFTKAGTRISAENFAKFKEAVNLIDEGELALPPESQPMQRASGNGRTNAKLPFNNVKKEQKNVNEDFGMEETEF